MPYLNEEHSMLGYKIVGGFSVPQLSLGTDYLLYSGCVDGLFGDQATFSDGHWKLPDIVPEDSAFVVTVKTSSGAVSGTKLVQVTKVIAYTISALDSADATIKLKFNYRELPMAMASPDMYDVPPVFAHVLADASHFEAWIEGDADYITGWISDHMRFFRHGNRVYYAQQMSTVTKDLDGVTAAGNDQVKCGVLLLASTTKIPNNPEMFRFHQRFCRYVGLDDPNYDEFMEYKETV